MTQLVNLTPHDVVLSPEGGASQSIPSSGVARVKVVQAGLRGTQFPVEVVREHFSSQTDGLPAPQEGVAYIVSAMVQDANPTRDDLYVPTNLVRDEQGRIVGARALRAPRFYMEP
jgi:hypothetical protein